MPTLRERFDDAVHNLVAHPLLVLCPPLGDRLHRATEAFQLSPEASRKAELGLAERDDPVRVLDAVYDDAEPDAVRLVFGDFGAGYGGYSVESVDMQRDGSVVVRLAPDYENEEAAPRPALGLVRDDEGSLVDAAKAAGTWEGGAGPDDARDPNGLWCALHMQPWAWCRTIPHGKLAQGGIVSRPLLVSERDGAEATVTGPAASPNAFKVFREEFDHVTDLPAGRHAAQYPAVFAEQSILSDLGMPEPFGMDGIDWPFHRGS